MINVNQITSKLALMPDASLRQFAEMHKEDPYSFSLAVAESNRRKQIRSQVPQEQERPKVADQEISGMSPMPEDVGIGALPFNMRMANGGIIGFAKGGDFSNEGRSAKLDYESYARQKAAEMGVDPDLAHSIFTIESNYNPNAQSKTGPKGVGQLTEETGKAYGVKSEDRFDPYKNMDASIAFMADLTKKYKGDPSKIAVGYNQGEGVLNKNLRANNGELNVAALKQEPQNYLKKLQKLAFNLAPGSVAQAESLPSVETPPVTQSAQDNGNLDLDEKIAASAAAVGLGSYPVKQAYNALQEKIKIADAGRVAQGTAVETAMAERAAQNASLPRLAGPSGGGVTQATDRIAAEKLAQEAARRQALITSGEMAGKFGPRAAISGLGNITKLALNPAMAGLGAIGYELGKAQQGVMASPSGSQLKEALYENPMLGAMDPDAALGAAIMDAPKINEQQQQKFNPAARADDRTKRDPANYRVPSTATQDDMPREMQSLENRFPLKKEDKKEIVDYSKENTPPGVKTKGFTDDDWLQFGLALMSGDSPYALQNIGKAGLVAVAGKKEREKEERAALSKLSDKTDMTKVIDRLMKDNKTLSYRDAYEIYSAGRTALEAKLRGIDVRQDEALTNRIRVYNDGLDKIKILGIVANSPKATPEQKQAYADAVAKLGPNPALQASGQQVAPAAITMPPLPGAKIVGSRPA